MKLYLEALEITTELSAPEFIRADITGKTDKEITDIQTAIEDVMSGKNYRLQKHFCGHEERKPCQTELIKEVN